MCIYTHTTTILHDTEELRALYSFTKSTPVQTRTLLLITDGTAIVKLLSHAAKELKDVASLVK